MRRLRASAPSRRAILAALLLPAAAGCRALTETVDERRCRALNAFAPDTAQMRVGQTRRFQATGFWPTGPGSCTSTFRDGFSYAVDAPAVVSVVSSTGVVTAIGAGTAHLLAVRRVDGTEYHGRLEIRVTPALAESSASR